MRLAVLGLGAVGGLLAALLVRSGEQVVCVATEHTAEHLARHGLWIDSAAFGAFHVRVEAVTRLASPVDACLVAVKATQLDSALERITSAAGDGLIVPLLNGVEHIALLRERYPARQVAPSVIWVEAARTGPGMIRHLTRTAEVELAATGANRARVAALADHLARAGPEVRLRTDEAAMLWAKLAFLAPLALLTTREGAPVGAIRTRHRPELIEVIREVATVARAQGVEVDPAAVLAMFDRIRPGLRSSMQRDAAAGRPTEVEAIGGAVLRAAARAGVSIPMTARLVADVRAADRLRMAARRGPDAS